MLLSFCLKSLAEWLSRKPWILPELELVPLSVHVGERQGSLHTIYAHPAMAPLPRHAGIDNRLAQKICQQLAVGAIR